MASFSLLPPPSPVFPDPNLPRDKSPPTPRVFTHAPTLSNQTNLHERLHARYPSSPISPTPRYTTPYIPSYTHASHENTNPPTSPPPRPGPTRRRPPAPLEHPLRVRVAPDQRVGLVDGLAVGEPAYGVEGRRGARGLVEGEGGWAPGALAPAGGLVAVGGALGGRGGEAVAHAVGGGLGVLIRLRGRGGFVRSFAAGGEEGSKVAEVLLERGVFVCVSECLCVGVCGVVLGEALAYVLGLRG